MDVITAYQISSIVQMIIGLTFIFLWYRERRRSYPIHSELRDLKSTNKYLKGQLQMATAEYQSLRNRLYYVNVNQLTDSEVKKLLISLHEAYFSHGDEKKFRDLMRKIGDVKSGSVKNMPKVKEYNGKRQNY